MPPQPPQGQPPQGRFPQQGQYPPQGSYPPPQKSGMPGWAIALIIIGSVLVMMLVCAGLLLPALGAARRTADKVKMSTQANGVVKRLLLYEQQNNQMPNAGSWIQDLNSLNPADPVDPLLAGPDGGERVYALNAAVFNRGVSNSPGDMVVVFEVGPDGPEVGGKMDLLKAELYFDDGASFGFADGSARYIKREEFDQLRWEP